VAWFCLSVAHGCVTTTIVPASSAPVTVLMLTEEPASTIRAASCPVTVLTELELPARLSRPDIAPVTVLTLELDPPIG
jgi:hypothetical protein